jgi:hypothetical protein
MLLSIYVSYPFFEEKKYIYIVEKKIYKMTLLRCDFTKAEAILPYLSLPASELDAFVAECPIVCLHVYGKGNPDIAGIGVL